MIKFCFLLFALSLMSYTAIGQSRTITGKVTDSYGFPIGGVNIYEKGSIVGVTSNSNGDYSISVSHDGILVYVFVGFDTHEEPLLGRDIVNIEMKESFLGLEELVVVGYGSMRRSDVTGAVSTVQGQAITQGVFSSFEQALQGRAAGLNATKNSGQPGGASSIRIRGINTIGSSNEPLYVLDGVPIDAFSGTHNSLLSSINPADIESIEVLKDASAAAIYGSRAANGVILIATKRAKHLESKVTYNGAYGIQELPNKLDVLNLNEFAQFWNTRSEIWGWGKRDEFKEPNNLVGDDWQDAMFNSSSYQDHHISISKATETNKTYFSAGYFNQEGIAKGSGFDRISARINIDNDINTWLNTGASAFVSQSSINDAINQSRYIVNTIGQDPSVRVHNDDGSWGGSVRAFNKSNPIAEATIIDSQRKTLMLSGNVFADIEITNSFVFRTEVGANKIHNNTYYFKPTFKFGEHASENRINEGRRNISSSQFWVVKNFFTWQPKIGRYNNFNILAGHEAQEISVENLRASRKNFVNNNFNEINMGDASTATNDGNSNVSALTSYFSRINYNYDGRYYFSASYRADGSSKFAKVNRWGFFPSIALAWKISGERFFAYNLSSVDNFKLRFGWGQVGNQNIPNYAYESNLSVVESQWGSGVLTSRLANPDVKWETTESTNFGFDLNLFRNKIELIFDSYVKNTKDLLMQAPYPRYAGTTGSNSLGAINAPWENIGAIENRGVEITLNTTNIAGRYFEWKTSFIYSSNKNKIKKLTGDEAVIDGRFNNIHITRSRVGDELGLFYGYKVIGMFNKESDFYITDNLTTKEVPRPTGLAISPTDVWVGDYIFEDTKEDGEINENDKTVIGNPHPKFQFGINNHIKFKNFDVSLFLNGAYGNDVVNLLRRELENPNSEYGMLSSVKDYAVINMYNSELPNAANVISNVYVSNQGTSIARLRSGSGGNDNQRFSDRFVEDGSYLRIKNITIGYTLAETLTQKAGISSLRFYASAQNLHTFTNYSGYDPEIGSHNQDMTLTGIDYGRYPAPRILSLGANITF